MTDQATVTIPVQVLKRYLKDATLRDNQAVTRLLHMDGVVHPADVPEPPERLCSRCGLPESATEWDSLFDVRVVTRAGEEGFSDLTQLLCDRHAVEVVNGLKSLGFKDHRHRGTNSLEDLDCPGAGFVVGGACPTPLEADPYDGSHVLGQPR